MANYKVAYGKKENMDLAIERGVIPPGCIILTEDSDEIFFYDLTRNIRTYEEKYKFESREAAESWVQQYDCGGQIISVHENGKCGAYIVNYDGQLSKLTGNDYIVSDKDPSESDINSEVLTHWINTSNESVFILTSIKEGKATWKKITGIKGDSSYDFVQSIALDTWMINHNLGKYPSVVVVDSEMNNVVGEINYIDVNTLYIRFSEKLAGAAYLN